MHGEVALVFHHFCSRGSCRGTTRTTTRTTAEEQQCNRSFSPHILIFPLVLTTFCAVVLFGIPSGFFIILVVLFGLFPEKYHCPRPYSRSCPFPALSGGRVAPEREIHPIDGVLADHEGPPDRRSDLGPLLHGGRIRARGVSHGGRGNPRRLAADSPPPTTRRHSGLAPQLARRAESLHTVGVADTRVALPRLRENRADSAGAVSHPGGPRVRDCQGGDGT